MIIKPCRKCGSTNIFVGRLWAECACGARSTTSDLDAGVIQRWNAEQDDKYGVYGKYHITKADGTPVDPDAQYFVLRLDTDLHARRAIMAYAESVEIENGTLSSELRTWAVELEQAAGETPQERPIIIAGYPNQMPPTVHVVYTQRCEVCKHWERTFGLDGICHNDDVINKLSPLSTEGAMQTDENFGCIFWQRKPGDNE